MFGFLTAMLAIRWSGDAGLLWVVLAEVVASGTGREDVEAPTTMCDDEANNGKSVSRVVGLGKLCLCLRSSKFSNGFGSYNYCICYIKNVLTCENESSIIMG